MASRREGGPLRPVDRRRLLAVVAGPDFIEPWLDRFYDPGDADLVLAAAETPLRDAEHTPTTGIAPDRAARRRDAAGGAAPGQRAPDAAALRRAWRRGVLERRDDGSFAPAGFHTRLEYWALFEGWRDVPDDMRARLCAWEGDWYADGLRERAQRLKDGGALAPGERGADYLLLHEAEALLRRAEHVYLWPCNCRAYVGSCRQPSLVCLRFENDRGIGWEISTERAVEIMREANRRGLMQVGEVPPGAGPVVAGALCNCCSDCCFEQYASRTLDAARVWPLSRHVAELPADCSRCGACARRCPFGAATMAAAADQAPVLDPVACRGCGVCASGCPDEAIAMRPLTTGCPREPS
jgi:Pyruvate/2-oxoacid:ferredoxin oxidoreductase delta subunit